MSLISNLASIKSQITAHEQTYHRPPNSVHLLAASKTHPADKITELFHAGQHAFGENYLQEALTKIITLSSLPIEWHFIGPIQRNKTKKIAEHFAWVQSIDDIIIAERLNNQRPAHLPPLNICIQVNISNEETKSGIHINDTLLFANQILTFPRLKLRGLMTIPAPKPTLALQRAECHKLFQLYQQLNTQGFNLDTLSMGMSDDMEAAIAEGSTLVRVGTNLFGKRL